MSFADRTSELWLEIDQLHLKYLQHEDNVSKIDHRRKLEGLVKEYLCLVPQDRKFVTLSTGDIINNSVRWISEFSLVKASEAFQCVEQYAANLINQPWRLEYRTIRQFNGFYMHNIKSVLSGAEKLFFDMGYTRDDADPEILKLQTNRAGDVAVNLDKVTQVARDCLLARMEAIILQEIYAGVVPQFPLSLEELMEFRRDHIGTPEDAVRELLYRKSQNRFQVPTINQPFTSLQQVYSPYVTPMGGAYAGFAAGPQNAFPQAATTTLATSGGVNPFGGNMFPGGAPGFPANPYQTGFMAPTATQNSAVPGLNGFYPLQPTQPAAINKLNGQMNGLNGMTGMHGVGSPPNGMPPMGSLPTNGGLPMGGMSANGMPVGSIPSNGMPMTSVPVGLTGNGVRHPEHSPAGSSTSTLRQGQIPTTILDLTGDDRVRAETGARPREKSSKAREHAAAEKVERPPRHENRKSGRSKSNRNSNGEQIESWDYVYKELEQQGYSKDQAERPDILAANRQSFVGTEYSEEDVRRNLNRMQIREAEPRGGRARDKSRNRNSRDITREMINTTSESEQEVSRYSSANSRNTAEEQQRPQRTSRSQGHQTQQGSHKQRNIDHSEKWECGACTYLNAGSNNICEMCSKSREKSYKATLVDNIEKKNKKEGEECHRCTLLNPPTAKVCDACGASLGKEPVI